MFKLVFYTKIFVFLFVFTINLHSQTTINGGRGMLRVQSAKTVQSKSMQINTFSLSFLNEDKLNGFGNSQTLSIGLTYGLKNNIEITSRIVPYQDDQANNWVSPGETVLGAKWQTPIGNRYIKTGFSGIFRFPTAKNHNVPYEVYSSDKIAMGLTGLVTIDFPTNVPLQVNANLGYLDNNLGTFLKKESTDQLILGLGVKIPAGVFIFYSEYTGEIFINNSAADFFDNSMRVTVGLKVKMPLGLIWDLGSDIGLSKSRDNYTAPLHKYAGWKLFTGITYHIKPGSIYKTESSPVRRIKQKDSFKDLKNRRQNVDEKLKELLEDLEKKDNNDKKNES